jgi:hypothetical protein
MKSNFKILILGNVLFFSTFIVCSCNQKNRIWNKKNNDLNKPNVTSKEMTTSTDSLAVAILSTEGELIKNLKYSMIDSKGQSIEQPEYLNYIKGYPLEDTIIGDFNGDGKREKAWFKDMGITAFFDCKENGTSKSCEGTIVFSDKHINPLTIENCPMAMFKNEGDLYGDGKDVIGVLPGWFNSSCREYSVFTMSNGGWKLACPSIGNTLNMREAGIVLVEKDKTKQGWVIIRESVDSYASEEKNSKIPNKYIEGNSCQWSTVVEQRIKLN